MANDQAPTIVVIRFETKYEKRKGGKMEAVDYCTYAPRFGADKTEITDRISNLNPGDGEKLGGTDNEEQRNMRLGFLKHRWSMIEREYDAWKSGHEIPESGTALGAWAGVNSNQAEVLRRHGVRTVEDLAEFPEGQLQKLQLPSTRELQRQAVAFLEGVDQAESAAQMTDLRDLNKALTERLDAAMELLEKQTPPDAKGGNKKAA